MRILQKPVVIIIFSYYWWAVFNRLKEHAAIVGERVVINEHYGDDADYWNRGKDKPSAVYIYLYQEECK